MNTTAPTCRQAGRNGSASSKTPAFITTRCVGMEWRRNTALTTPRWVPLPGWGGSGAQPWGSGHGSPTTWARIVTLHVRLGQPADTLCFSFFISQIIVSVSKSTVFFFFFFNQSIVDLRLPRWLSGKRTHLPSKRCSFSPWIGKIPWRRKWQPTPVFLSGKSHGQRSLVGYSPGGRKELDTI